MQVKLLKLINIIQWKYDIQYWFKEIWQTFLRYMYEPKSIKVCAAVWEKVSQMCFYEDRLLKL